MGSANHHSILVANGEDKGKYIGREEIKGFHDGSLEIEGSDIGVDDQDEVKGLQMGLETPLTYPVGWKLK